MKHHETLVIRCNDIGAQCVDVGVCAATLAIALRSFDATISALDAETSALDAETSAIARSYRRYRCGVTGDIGVEFPAISRLRSWYNSADV